LREEDREAIIKKSVELLKQGATMLPEHCPACMSPLYRLRSGEVVCPLHGRVLLVKRDEELLKASVESVLSAIEERVAAKLSSYVDAIKEASGSVEEREVAKRLKLWLEVLEAVRRGLWWWFIPPGAVLVALAASLLMISTALDEFFSPRLRER